LSLFSKLLVTLATLAYPVLVYVAIGRFSPFWLALLLAGLMAVRACIARDAVWLLAGVGAALLALATLLGDSWLPLKLYPVMVSAVLLGVFGASLLRPPTVIERIARLREPELPPAAVAYTRKVTQAWCLFFVANGLIALATVLWGSEELWLLYNGLISYLLMGALFAGEWLLRQRLRARGALSGAAHG
jgi:uncharacterized membrane protein